jgi:hypothetical protein
VNNKAKKGTTTNAVNEFADEPIPVCLDEFAVEHQQPDSMNKFSLAVREDSSRCRCPEVLTIPILKGVAELSTAIQSDQSTACAECGYLWDIGDVMSGKR